MFLKRNSNKMTNKELNIADTFRDLDILSNDIVMIHGDSGIAAQFTHIDPDKRLQELINQIITYFSPDGTIVVPTFSYSFTKNENFDVNNSPSEVGKFSECFRQNPLAYRSSHPIFSVCTIGKHFEKFEKSRIDDCFGKETVFDLLYKLDGKIVCLGCDFARGATFVHYVEQFLGVSHRYMKKFSGNIINKGKPKFVTTSYYVRDLKQNSIIDFDILKKKLMDQKKLKLSNIGRFPVIVIKTNDFFQIAIEFIKNDNSLKLN